MWHLIEDRPTPPSVYNHRLYLTAAAVGTAGIIVGYDTGFLGGTISLPQFQHSFGLTKSDNTQINANVVSVWQAGAFFGALFGYAGGYFLGRRMAMLVAAAVYILGAGVMLAATNSLSLAPIYAGRVLTGLGVGAQGVLVHIYISELAPPSIRGRLLGFYEVFWELGGLAGFWVNYGVKLHVKGNAQWVIPIAIQLIPGGIFFSAVFFVKESHRWLLSKGRQEEALSVLCWVRGLQLEHEYLRDEIARLDMQASNTQSTIGIGFWAPFKAIKSSRPLQWRLWLGFSLFIWQNASGVNGVNFYTPEIFENLGVKGEDQDLFSTGLFSVVKAIFTLVWAFYLIDRFGRRKVLMVGALGCSVCMWAIGALVKEISGASSRSNGGKSTAAVFFLYLFTAFEISSWNGTPWVFNAEIFDERTRLIGVTCAGASQWLWNFVISRATPSMFATMHYGYYFFFAALMLLAILYVFLLVPETKSIPLDSMDHLFSTKPLWKAHGIVFDDSREGSCNGQGTETRKEIGKSIGGRDPSIDRSA